MKKIIPIIAITMFACTLQLHAQLEVFPGGNVGINTSVANNVLSIGGTGPRTIWMERNIIPATAGQGLTLSSGGAYIGGTNLAGGDLTIKSGISTGTGTSAIHFFTATAGSSGTADRTPTEKMTILGSGFTGIGTNSPNNLLGLKGSYASIDVNANSNTNSFISGSINNSIKTYIGTVGVSGAFSAGSAIGDFVFRTVSGNILFTNNNGTTTMMKLDNYGNLGIGTTSPLLRGDVRGSSAKGTTTAYTNYFQVASNDASNPLSLQMGIKTDATANNRYGAIEVDDAGVKRKLVLQPNMNGTVDIGYVSDTSTSYKFQIHSTTKRGLLCEKTDSTQYSYNLVSKVYGAQVKAFTVSYNGSDDRIYMYGNGDIYCRSLTEYSDVSLKENITTISSPLTSDLKPMPSTISFFSKNF